MTHKSYYQTAASEVADGVLDTALWTKVNVELVGADDDVRQAKYIQLRAQELSIENAQSAAHGAWAYAWPWIKWGAVGGVAFVVIVNAFDYLFST